MLEVRPVVDTQMMVAGMTALSRGKFVCYQSEEIAPERYLTGPPVRSLQPFSVSIDPFFHAQMMLLYRN